MHAAAILELNPDLGGRGNKMDLDQLTWFTIFKLHRFIPSQRGDLVKIHLIARQSAPPAIQASHWF